jgi:Zn-dependent protease
MSMSVELVLIQFLVLIFALSVHECSHAWMAWRLGDATAFMLGRVTLNPMKQLTPIGSVVFPLIGMFFGVPLIGWAKPTPVNRRNFSKYKRDDVFVTMAGPVSNLGLAFLSLILLIAVKHLVPHGVDLLEEAIGLAGQDPLASAEGLPALFPLLLLLWFSMLINATLFVFNLLPIPPLDGSHLLKHYLPYRWQEPFQNMGMYGTLILYIVVLRFNILEPLYGAVLGVFLRLLN